MVGPPKVQREFPATRPPAYGRLRVATRQSKWSRCGLAETVAGRSRTSPDQDADMLLGHPGTSCCLAPWQEARWLPGCSPACVEISFTGSRAETGKPVVDRETNEAVNRKVVRLAGPAWERKA